ncbi:MAG TPA: hypothetical protein ENI13_00090 [candidate division CPR3 bacterium]|uniref:Uncharacterized protein n=1 Tax=candidate division CPR3 bacterium TaxID=2268181 RepID=A0A7C1SX28_UNCC3|nr:hypothetical protein [candidate division CPR3 bacterium]
MPNPTKQIIEEFNNLKVEEYGKWRIDRGIVRVFLRRVLATQREEFRKMVERIDNNTHPENGGFHDACQKILKELE